MTTAAETIGPVLFARGADQDGCRLSAILGLPEKSDPPVLVPVDGQAAAPRRLYSKFGRTVWRYDFSLPACGGAAYRLGNAVFPVAADCSGDVRIAYISCNGQEHGDGDRPAGERNAMWRRLVCEHGRAPFALLLHGGDQLYADEVVRSHPALSSWAASTLPEKVEQAVYPDMLEAAENYYFERYLKLYANTEFAYLGARVPALMMWDDHDIFDGWGSLPERLLDSPVGRGLFDIARRMFMLFQLGATDDIPVGGMVESQSRSLTQTARFPRFSVIAPDLRSERRPTRVLGPAGWAALERALAETNRGEPILIMSSVPLLGPRLSWVEKLMGALPGLQKYEDDLRDQWQSRSHRAEWQRMLRTLERRAAEGGNAVTIVSGEIHLATRGEMPLGNGMTLRQLVASGIAHPPPPRLYARSLGLLAVFGESPLPGSRIHLKPLPGHRPIYIAERNYLVLERRGVDWSAAWELEDSGRTTAVRL